MKFLFLLLLVVSCATPVYQKIGDNGYRVGYEDTQLSRDRYQVRFVHTKKKQVYVGFLRRSAEITLAKKKKFFCEISSQTGKDGNDQLILGGAAKDWSLDQHVGVIILKNMSSGDKCYEALEIISRTKQFEE